jgi:hypothetical protein
MSERPTEYPDRRSGRRTDRLGGNKAHNRTQAKARIKIPYKAFGAFEAAIKRDCAWFKSNPIKTRLRRKVRSRELPRHLRRIGITEVVIERAAPCRFVRTFFDHAGRTVATGIDELNKEVVPSAPRHTINVPQYGPVSVDRADSTSADREYFEKNPDIGEYERDALPVELAQVEFSSGLRPLRGRVQVRQLAPEVRIRELWIRQ